MNMRSVTAVLLVLVVLAGCSVVGLPPLVEVPLTAGERAEMAGERAEMALAGARFPLVKAHAPEMAWQATESDARALCGLMGLDLARHEGRRWARERGQLRDEDRVRGCYVPALTVTWVQDGQLVSTALPAWVICAKGDHVCAQHQQAHHEAGIGGWVHNY